MSNYKTKVYTANEMERINQKQILSIYEVSAIVGVHPQTIYNWVDIGTLVSFRMGRNIRIFRKDVDSLLCQRVTAQSAIATTIKSYGTKH